MHVRIVPQRADEEHVLGPCVQIVHASTCMAIKVEPCMPQGLEEQTANLGPKLWKICRGCIMHAYLDLLGLRHLRSQLTHLMAKPAPSLGVHDVALLENIT